MPSKTKTQEARTDERIVDEETGLILLKDAFGGDEHQVLDVFNPDEWDVVEEDFGEVVNWEETPTMAGTLVNQKVVMVDHGDDRGEQATNLYSFLDAVTGERRAVYGNYQIDNALMNKDDPEGKSPYIGRLVLIKWMGKREQNKGGRTLNAYTIAVKKS